MSGKTIEFSVMGLQIGMQLIDEIKDAESISGKQVRLVPEAAWFAEEGFRMERAGSLHSNGHDFAGYRFSRNGEEFTIFIPPHDMRTALPLVVDEGNAAEITIANCLGLFMGKTLARALPAAA